MRNNSDEPYSKTLFDNIERTLYYIETQLTHVDDQLRARYDSYNPNNKYVMYFSNFKIQNYIITLYKL